MSDQDPLIKVHITKWIPVSQWDEPLVKCNTCGNEVFPIELERQSKQNTVKRGLGVGELTIRAKRIADAQRRLATVEEEWEQAAILCEHCTGKGGDGLECSHPNTDDDDPFCYASRCPAIK